MKKLVIAAALVGAATPGWAHAEVLKGWHVGIQSGFESEKVDSAELFADIGLGTVTVDKTKKDRITIGATLGYDATVGKSFLIGAEIVGAINPGTNSQNVTFTRPAPFPSVTQVRIDYKSNFTFEATVRAGVKIGTKAAVYARGGYANSRLKADVIGSSAVTVSGNNNGWLLGGGAEVGLTKKISLRAEYRYFDLNGPVSRNQVVAGLNFYF